MKFFVLFFVCFFLDFSSFFFSMGGDSLRFFTLFFLRLTSLKNDDRILLFCGVCLLFLFFFMNLLFGKKWGTEKGKEKGKKNLSLFATS